MNRLSVTLLLFAVTAISHPSLADDSPCPAKFFDEYGTEWYLTRVTYHYSKIIPIAPTPEGDNVLVQVTAMKADDAEFRRLRGTVFGLPILCIYTFATGGLIKAFDATFPMWLPLFPGSPSDVVSDGDPYVYRNAFYIARHNAPCTDDQDGLVPFQVADWTSLRVVCDPRRDPTCVDASVHQLEIDAAAVNACVADPLRQN